MSSDARMESAEVARRLHGRLLAISRRELDDRTISPGDAEFLAGLVERSAGFDTTSPFAEPELEEIP